MTITFHILNVREDGTCELSMSLEISVNVKEKQSLGVRHTRLLTVDL